MSGSVIHHAIPQTQPYCYEIQDRLHANLKGTIDPVIQLVMPLVNDYRMNSSLKIPVISIAVCSGVGKSYFSQRLLEECEARGIQAKILKFDDFLDPEPFDGAIDEIHPHFDYNKLHAFLRRLINKEQTIEKPTWDHTQQKPSKITTYFNLDGVELLIFEGEFTLCDEKTYKDPEAYNFIQYSNVKVIIDANDEDIIEWDWQRARDIEAGSREEFNEERKQSLTKYRKTLNPLKEKADFIFFKDTSHTLTPFK